MASYTDAVARKYATLAANVVDTVVLGSNYRTIRVENYGSTDPLYVTVDGTDPAVGGNDTWSVPAKSQRLIPGTGAGKTTVKLICVSAYLYGVLGS